MQNFHLCRIILKNSRVLTTKIDSPFHTLDQEGVGELIKMGIEKGRKSRPDLEVGICGEHGGDAQSVKFCHRVGMNYVSCSPYRVPIARLASAQAVLEEKKSHMGAIAEFERSLIKERVLAGIRRAKENGIRLGKPPLEV